MNTQAPTQPPPVRISRTFNAPRELVFKAWSSAEHVKAWFSPETYTCPEARVEMKVGGVFDVLMRSPGGEDHWTRGRFTEVTPYDRLVLDIGATDAAGRRLFDAVTVVTFLDTPGGTVMEVVQSYTFRDPAMAAPMVAGAAEGWRTTLDKLQAEVARIAAEHGVEAHSAARARIPESPVRSVVHATFHLERTYDATPARVWAALTDPAAKAKWFGGVPGEVEILERRVDVRPGGKERLKGRWKSGVTSTFDAVYQDVIPGERLVYTYEMQLDDRKISVSLATMQVKPDGAGTRLLVTEQGAFLDGYDDAGSREQGTRYLLEQLGRSLSA